jgi:hypothetical protein
MTSLEEKKAILDNFEGFYCFFEYVLYEDPSRELINLIGNTRFELPTYISPDYNYVLGRCVDYISPKTLQQALCTGASLPIVNSLFNNKAFLYVLSWNENSKAYKGNRSATDDLTQFSFTYKGESIFTSVLFELNNNENINKNAGLVGIETSYKIVPNNPTNEDIDKFLFNPENCDAISFIFVQIQEFLVELNNLYQQGQIKQIIPKEWFSDATKCPEQSLVLHNNLLKFYVNVCPGYYSTWNKENVDIDNILKLYN